MTLPTLIPPYADPQDALYAERTRLLARIAELETALGRIERWFGEFPATGKFWDKAETDPVSYGAQYGSNGERDFMRAVARAALSPPIEGPTG